MQSFRRKTAGGRSAAHPESGMHRPAAPSPRFGSGGLALILLGLLSYGAVTSCASEHHPKRTVDAPESCSHLRPIALHSDTPAVNCELVPCDGTSAATGFGWQLLRDQEPDRLILIASGAASPGKSGRSEAKWQPTTVPGYWPAHRRPEGAGPGGTHPPNAPWSGAETPSREGGSSRNTGAGLFRLKIRFPTEQSRACYSHLLLVEASSAALLFWNGQTFGRTGRIGHDRFTEEGRLAPTLLILPPGPRAGTHTLDVLVTNHHARSGGIHGLLLGSRGALTIVRDRHLLWNGVVTGVLVLAVAFFLLLFLAVRTARVYLAFVALLLCLLARTVSSGSLLELTSPEHDWTDIRLLLEYLSGVSLTPVAFYWFLYCLFPGLIGTRVGSRRHALTRLYFRAVGWFTITGGASLTVWFLIVRDVTQLGAHHGFFVLGFLGPSIALLLASVFLAALRSYPGSLSVLAGSLALALAAAADSYSVVRGDTTTLYVPLGTTALVLLFSLAPARQFQDLHQRAIGACTVLQSANHELRRKDRDKGDFLAAYSRALATPVQHLLELALERANAEGTAKSWTFVEQTELALAPLERLLSFCQLNEDHSELPELQPAGLIAVGAETLRGLTGLEPQIDVPPALPRVRGRSDWIVLAIGEIGANLASYARVESLLLSAVPTADGMRIALFASGAGCALDRNGTKGAASPAGGLGFGLAVVRRVAELHGSRLEITSGGCGSEQYTTYSFCLPLLRRTRRERLGQLEQVYRFLEAGLEADLGDLAGLASARGGDAKS